MTRAEEIEHCTKSAENYDDGEFDLYDAEMGWEEWMEPYVEKEDNITASEHYSILSIQAEGWNSAHPNDKISDREVLNKSRKYC